MLSSLTDALTRHLPLDLLAVSQDTLDSASLREALSRVPDPRARRGVRYPFIHLLQIIVTAVFAVGVYGLSLVLGFSLHGMKFLGILVPPGTPGWLLPLMIPIELISQLARPISLAVRLFANMTAGHVILGVLFGLAISGGLLIGWLPFAFTIAMNGLEVGIAFIQAYIFTVLSCVYLGDAVTLHGHSEEAH